MLSLEIKPAAVKSALAATALLFVGGAAFAQQQVNLTAGQATASMPDGNAVPMWGYSCGAAVTNSTATCTALNPAATSSLIWSPVIITVPSGQGLQINLTNSLPAGVPTSITIVGQLGGGLGTNPTYKDSPAHAVQGATWPIVGDTSGAAFTPPAQGQRVQSFSTEVVGGATTSLTWTAPRPGTYLLESGTHPSIQGPMGLYGMIVVTAPASAGVAGTAYPGVTYSADVPLLTSEIDPNQNSAVQTAVTTSGFSETSTRVLRDTLTAVVLATDANGNVINAGSGYTAGSAINFTPASGCTVLPTATIDQVDGSGAIVSVHVASPGQGCTQLNAMATGGNGQAQLVAGLSLAGGMCSDGAAACYPPAVNYTPLYYLINGVAFDKTNAGVSMFSTSPATGVSGNVLVRLVNAGLRMHVPSIVGSTTGTPAAPGMSLVAEDGNVLPGVQRVQSEVFMAAGKTYDVMINAPVCTPIAPATTCTTPALPIYDRQLSLSGNSTNRDAGMLAYIGVNGGTPPSASAIGSAVANPDTYNAVVPGLTLTVSDPSKGVMANDINISGVKVTATPSQGTLTLNTNGTFTYVANNGWTGSDSFTYCGNSTTTAGACALVTLGQAAIESGSGITMGNASYTSPNGPKTTAPTQPAYLFVNPPGVLASDSDSAGYPLTVDTTTVSSVTPSGATISINADGSFTATATAAGSYTFTYKAKNSQGTQSANTATVTITFPTASGPQVTVLDGSDKKTVISDYRWIIEEDQTFFVDPKCTTNPLPAGCATINSQGTPFAFGTNFHTSHMPVVAAGCTGAKSCESGQTLLGTPAVCDVGNGACRTTASQQTQVDPSQVQLDPKKRYYITVLPGDAAEPFIAGYASAPDCSPAGVAAGSCGHGMGGAPIAAGQTSVMVLTQPSPYPPATVTVFVFEDDFPLNGEHDAGGGVDVLASNEQGLGNFQITLFDDAGGTGDATGQPTYDMFNMPLSNSLAGTIDPVTGLDACPISPVITDNVLHGDGTQKGITGMIVTCPKYESDGTTLSPLAGQAVVKNLWQGRYGVVATPGADRIARGEEWLQTNTLDGQKAHDSFMRIGEPAYFQEFGPAGYHVTIGFANPKIINDRRSNAANAGMCNGTATGGGGLACNYELKGHVTTARMSRPPDERLYGSGTRDSFAFTQCYVSLGDPDGADFAFAKCDADGGFDLTGLPPGNWKLTIFDQWNDQIVDGISQPIGLTSASTNGTNVLDVGEIATHQWQANIYTRTFFDQNGNGVSDKDATGNDTETGLALVPTNIRFRDGSYSNFNNTDLNGYAGFNEIFPLFNWYTIETDTTRFKTTGVHVVYDAGGAVDGSKPGGTACNGSSVNPCGNSSIAQNFANTYEAYPLPSDLSVPGAVYCAEGADCGTSASSFQSGTPIPSSSTNHSTGRIDPPYWFGSYGWQGFSGQNSFLEFGKKPYVEGETGGIHGHVVYASTRPFDDPQLLLQLSWEPLVPHVRVNLYQEGVAADGVTPTLTLIDHTDTSSFDDWAQGFRADGKPNMNCPGQSTSDPYFFALKDQPQYLDFYSSQHGGAAAKQLPYDSQYKCYDGMHNWNQLQPAPYDGMYSFPSVTGLDPATGKPTGTNCTACTTNPDTDDQYRHGTPMLPAGKYVVEVVVPPGYELVKEEDKNILIGDNFIAPATMQFGGLGNIFILPDQAAIGETYNANNPQNPTTDLGVVPRHEGDTGSVESFWPCVGAMRTVPDYISLFPGSAEVSPFAGANRPLCDRKEVELTDQSAALVKFYVFTSTHVASHFTGVITDDLTAEFDPFSPQFGEKFAPAYLPVSIKDWTGNEVSRVYSDEFGAYNGLNYSTWEVNPPNPTGYGPTMMVTCMNDRGTGATPDPLFQAGYSQFCYELPFMPGQTGYFDTPVVATSAFSEGYNHPDCSYPDATPAISTVTSTDIGGPWVSVTGHQLTINALGDVKVDNYGYSGPSVTATPFNQQTVTRHFGFGSQSIGTQCTAGQSCVALLGSDGISYPLTGVTWTDGAITGNVSTTVTINGSTHTLPLCAVQQQAQYITPAPVSQARCGQLVITAANGKTSVDTVTVTVGGKTPTLLASGQTIQSAINTAKPGDMILIPPGVYHELLLMWKPVRLQGVGAASTIIDADAHPAAQLLDSWRAQVNCLFGLTPDGRPRSPGDNTCTTGWSFASGGSNTTPTGTNFKSMIVDRLPFEAVLGWDATLNGNLAEQLIEPSLMGAYEGAAITVLGKGVLFPTGTALSDAFGATTGAAFPDNTRLLNGTSDCTTSRFNATNPYPSNFYCNPSSIDGLGIRNSSQGGGGIYVHAFAHFLQVANNRVYNNIGTLGGGMTIGQGEHPDVNLGGFGALPTTFPTSCESSFIPNLALPFCFDMHVNVHHNAVTLNSSIGDELFSSTPAGAGGVNINTGTDYYQFTNNWVCGNMSTGDGAGLAHIGFIKNGDIEHNSILFNQTTNPTITTNGGGLLVMGAPDVDPTCGTTNDRDCAPDPTTVTPSDGTGPGLVINANLILGNGAESGSGGGLRLQHVNGNDVINFPNGLFFCSSFALCAWNTVNITNNIIADNVAGWDGGGVSLIDALAVNIVNNTIIANDSTASSGVLFDSLFAPLASAPGKNCTNLAGDRSCPQPAGLVSNINSAILQANLPTSGFVCPPGHGTNGSCRYYSDPLMYNDIFWQNRSFFIGVGGFGDPAQNQNQQKLVTLFNPSFTGGTPTAVASQAATGTCVAGTSYWDIGVRGDTGPGNHTTINGTQLTLNPDYSVVTDTTLYTATHNTSTSPAVLSQYCNGSRVPPEAGLGAVWLVPPGTNETNGLPTPVFSLTASATVDEGNNWINMRWGPLALTNPNVQGTDGNYGGGDPLGNYGIGQGSSAINHVPSSAGAAYQLAPLTDFYGTLRKTNNAVDSGAVEFISPNVPTLTSISPTSGARGATVAVTLSGNNLTGATAVNVSGSGVNCTITGTPTATTVTASCTIARLILLGSRDVSVVTPNGTTNTVQFTVTGATIGFGGPSPALTTPVANRNPKSGTVTVTNTASGATAGQFTFTAAPTVTRASGSGAFSVTGGTCVSGTVLNPGDSCTVVVQYVPPAAPASATSTGHVNVTGTGTLVATTSSNNFTGN
jgi:Bacterial Ig domain